MAAPHSQTIYLLLLPVVFSFCFLVTSAASSNAAESGSSSTLINRNSLVPGANPFGNKRNLRSIYGLGPKMLQISRSKIPIELDLLVENEDSDRSKRFDDYGHMRFGKRGGEEQFDDYGHMRFGRST